ncbi:hypothetical protein DCAR_0519294 [Daucus carota subsp. sativus]|uniref:Uncharacterized protein n=1 Tax=Daucus carota subsp. sativus TaxID=79200 RepID=A0A164XV71_DAUCS|nr:hypothetical protein DCAR_0519294 [Daucus carota subsp. sativus]
MKHTMSALLIKIRIRPVSQSRNNLQQQRCKWQSPNEGTLKMNVDQSRNQEIICSNKDVSGKVQMKVP